MSQRFMCLSAIASMLVSGCYSGFTGSADEIGQGTADDGGSGQTSGPDEGPQDDDPQSLCADEDVGATDLRRLTAQQYDHTIRDLLGLDGGYTADFSPDEHVGAFKSNAKALVVELQLEEYRDAAEAVAVDATADLSTLLSCANSPTDACAEEFLLDFATRAYRRPLDPDQAQRVLDLYRSGRDENDGRIQSGLRIAVAAVLQSPFFLYHLEFGQPGTEGGPARLTSHELASRLSYFLWDTMPDDALFDAATSGDLETEDGIRAQVERMLQDPKTQAAIASFHQQWLGVDELEDIGKDPEMFPGFDAALAASMKADVASFARWVLVEGDGRLETLLTANVTVTDDPRLHALYGVTPDPDRQPGDPIELPADQRAGVLTMPGVLAEHAHPDQTSPIHRGVLVRQEFFCQPIPPPPEDVDDAPPSPDPDATTRERFDQHTSDPSCAGCHALIDPLGFGLEAYDAVGAFRTEEGNGLPIDARGNVTASDVAGEFDGAPELAEMLAQSRNVQDCFSRQWFRFALGRFEAPADACTVERLSTTFAESDQDIRTLLREIALSNAFRMRAPDA